MIASDYATSEPAALPRPGPTGIPLVLRELDEVPDDQEVAREPHLADDGELPREPLVVVLRRCFVAVPPSNAGSLRLEPSLEPLLREVLEVRLGRPVSSGDGEGRNLEPRVHDDAAA